MLQYKNDDDGKFKTPIKTKNYKTSKATRQQ